MGDPQFTPGPWEAAVDDETACVLAPVGSIAELDGEYTSLVEMSANAHLMAAAPDLYEALVAIERTLLHPNQMIDEALAQARGEKADV